MFSGIKKIRMPVGKGGGASTERIKMFFNITRIPTQLIRISKIWYDHTIISQVGGFDEANRKK